MVLEQTTSRRGNGKPAINLKKTGEEVSFLENPNEDTETVVYQQEDLPVDKK